MLLAYVGLWIQSILKLFDCIIFLFLFSSLYLFLGQLLWPVAFWDGVLLCTPADLALKLRKFRQCFFILALQSWGFKHGMDMWLPHEFWHLNPCPHNCTPNALSYWAISLALKVLVIVHVLICLERVFQMENLDTGCVVLGIGKLQW